MSQEPVSLETVADLVVAFAEREAADPEAYPSENVAALYDAGVVIAPFPASLGGSEWSLRECVDAIELVASHSASTALLLSMPLGLAGIYGIGTDAAPEEYRESWGSQIEGVAADYRAHRFYAACNSERGAGGSLEATTTVARLAEDGQFRVTGDKILASSGRNADVFFSTAKVSQEDLPGGGIVEFFLVRRDAPGVTIASDWDGFGMRSTESQSVHYEAAPAEALLGFPNVLAVLVPTPYWYCLFAAIPLGCAAGILRTLGTPIPSSPALRLRFAEATMRVEAMRAYVRETAREWRPGAPPAYSQRVLRMKTYVSSEATKLCAELFALGGGRHYRRSGAAARLLADAFAGTALRPPLSLALDTLVEQFGSE